MSVFVHFQHTLNRLFNNSIKLYWYYISFPWDMKGGSNWSPPPPLPPEKTTLKKPSLLRVTQVYISLSNQIKFESPKYSLPLKRFIVCLSVTLNLKKLKVRQKHISRILPILISTTTNLLHVYYVNIASYETLEKIKISL